MMTFLKTPGGLQRTGQQSDFKTRRVGWNFTKEQSVGHVGRYKRGVGVAF